MLKLINPNYCATVVKVEKLVQLENCNNVQAAIIMGNQIIVSKEVKIGDIGLFFPVEVQLSKKYLSENNLYRKKGDYRPDWIVKEEMWRDISKSYNIELIYEDRNQVVRRARALDLKVAQVKYGNY